MTGTDTFGAIPSNEGALPGGGGTFTGGGGGGILTDVYVQVTFPVGGVGGGGGGGRGASVATEEGT